jgi:hypothetical protein
MSRWSALRKAVQAVAELERSTRPAGPAPAGRRRVVRSARAAVGRRITYAPQSDGAADPGEVVWAGVAYEDQPDVVKDRPVLVVGRKDARTVLGLMLSSQEHRADDADWFAVGSGSWDREGRPSFVRLDRVLELAEDGIRREGAVLDRARFERVSQALRDRGGWG